MNTIKIVIAFISINLLSRFTFLSNKTLKIILLFNISFLDLHFLSIFTYSNTSIIVSIKNGILIIRRKNSSVKNIDVITINICISNDLSFLCFINFISNSPHHLYILWFFRIYFYLLSYPSYMNCYSSITIKPWFIPNYFIHLS